ncbi:MAG: sorbosone dehydrogenase family protein [Sedimentisphaerales bacterium]
MQKAHVLIAAVIIATALPLSCYSEPTPREAIDGGLIALPHGFRIEIYADDVPNARSMTLGPGGIVFVGSRGAGKVYAVIDRDNDRRADTVEVVDSELHRPNGVAFFHGDLYVAEISRILRYESIEERLDDPPEPVVVNDSFPTDEHHGWKYIDFGPDGKLYVPVGAPCNICEPPRPIYATITRMNPDGTGLEIFAKGIRNTVGFAWHPDTHELWFTDNGRDWLGDNRPPDELNKAPKPGMHFGFPYCHGDDILDPDFGAGHSCDQFTKPEMQLGPHVAALGMLFYTGRMFPPKYAGQIFIAEHGSWNRSVPIGYRVSLVTLKDGKAEKYQVFAEGWLQQGDAWGRPVDVLQMPDGALLVSDDESGTIYRISYNRSR